MRIGPYLNGIALEGFSPFTPAECAARINAAVPSRRSLFRGGPVGRVRGDGLRLIQSSGLSEYNMKPVLTGRLVPEGGGTRLELRYRAPERA